MFQNSRLNELLEYFLMHKEYIASSKLVKQFQISERTLRNDIRDINKELKKYHAQILLKRKEGYYLHLDESASADLLEEAMKEKYQQLDSADRRINHLIIKLLYADNYLRQDDLADDVFVSINTIINYLKVIRDILSRYDLTLQTKANLGYRIIGEELDMRKCAIDLITSNTQQYAFQFSNEQKSLLNHRNLELIKEIVMVFNRTYDLHFSDYNLKNLILHIALSISRLQAGKTLAAYPVPQNQQLNDLLDPLITHIEEKFQIKFKAAERNYIYSYYASSANELFSQQNHFDHAQKLVQDFLNYIYESSHIDLRTDRLLFKDLSQHLQSTLSAKYYRLDKKNPLLNTIKNNYILAYELTETAAYQTFEHEPFELSEDEIGYIALHVGAAIERYFDTDFVHRKRALIVYDSSYAEGSFLAAKISTFFKDALEIAGRYPSHELSTVDYDKIDLIISTVPIKHMESIPVVVVEIPLDKKDIKHVARAVTKENEHPVSKIVDFFSPSLFVRTAAQSREEIIHILSSLLKKTGCVTDSFEEKVLERESRISTAMDGVVALPHPMSICSSRSMIAVGILKQPVKWSEKDHAQIILMLALADDKKKELKTLYDTFVAITNNPALESLLLQSQSIQEFLQILKEHIPEDFY